MTRVAGPSDGTADVRREAVRARYAEAASGGGCCGAGDAGDACCGPMGCSPPTSVGARPGYTREELSVLPSGADLGLGCGHPTALLSLRPGEVVLDLGSGGGIDCFLAAPRVGPTGRVIGVDMTPEMIARARRNGRAGGYANVEFRLGEIEHLPVADGSVDAVVSNCVINLVPDPGAVYREAFRVLRPGGRLAVSDVVASRPIAAAARADPGRWAACSSGALTPRQIARRLRGAGFSDIRVERRVGRTPGASRSDGANLGVVPADIRATRPRTAPP